MTWFKLTFLAMSFALAATASADVPAQFVGKWGIAGNWQRCKAGFPAPNSQPTIELKADGTWISLPHVPDPYEYVNEWSGSADGRTFEFGKTALWIRHLTLNSDGVYRGWSGDHKGCFTAVYLGK